jgi:organic hydroperoxide reductase OsmC/OhrA
MAADDDSIALTITQESDYAFRVAFDDTSLPPLLADETPPLGAGKGPDPGRLLGASIGNCLCASLLFALRKFKNAPGTIVARVRIDHARNAKGRLRIGKVAVEIALPETAAGYAQIDRILAQFEQFCTITESVRAGVPVEVTVKDGSGAVLRVSEHAQ